MDLEAGASIIGPSGFKFLNSLAVNRRGELYAAAGKLLEPSKILKLDPETGTASVAFETHDPVNLQTLSFDADGNLFGAYHNVYYVNRQTGALHYVAPSGVTDGVRGFEFL